jgi:hypothetical protein
MNIETVEVPNKSVYKIINDSKIFDPVFSDKQLLSGNYFDQKLKTHSSGIRHMAIYHPGVKIYPTDADLTIRSMKVVINGQTYTGRPATVHELASYEIKFGKQLSGSCVGALGEHFSQTYGYPYFAFRHSKKVLDIKQWEGSGCEVLRSHWRFLVVFEKVPEGATEVTLSLVVKPF